MTEAHDTREFTGFPADALAFLRALRRNNRRDWFEANRARYERSLRAPLEALVEEMDVRLAELAPEIVGTPKRSLFRIHRDVRFSADKTPYKTHAACWFHHMGAGGGATGSGPHGGAGFYLHIEPGGSSLGGGIWMPPRPTLRRLRDAIDTDGAPLAALLREPGLRTRFGGLAPEAMLTRMPRGYADTHPRAELLRHQSFTVGRLLSERELLGPLLPDLLAEEYARILPLVRWINQVLGLRPLGRR